MNDWGTINGEISRSKIKRFNWKTILGISLTEMILSLRNTGLNSAQASKKIMASPGVQRYVRANPLDTEQMFNCIEISTSARYGENKTADKLAGDKVAVFDNIIANKDIWKKIIEMNDRIKILEDGMQEGIVQ